MAERDMNYFVCSLGEGRALVGDKFNDLNQLIETRACENSNLPAVGFYCLSYDDKIRSQVLSFAQVHRGIIAAANSLQNELGNAFGTESVALLCSSSPEFFFTWLACVWSGVTILLIAPESTPAAIASLCQQCNISVVLSDPKHLDLARGAANQDKKTEAGSLRPIPLPFNEISSLITEVSRDASFAKSRRVKGTDIAYIHHTSGTSSGAPKPIPQTHYGAVGAVACFNGIKEATFTTTPLYHGGPADVIRAWASSAMVWLFPSHQLPITAGNVTKCLVCSDIAYENGQAPRVKYFTSVPYVVELMSANEVGLGWLQSMALVGVGGAALPKQVGDNLVDCGVHLVSRFGSAECGFLASSHRDYGTDPEWQYLRMLDSPGHSLPYFETRDQGLSELIVPADWPQLAKSNRHDGSYATSDLFEPHSSIRNAWRYHSRADSSLILVTGKKFDPIPMETELASAVGALADVLIFGNGMPYPGALLFRSQAAAPTTDSDFLHMVTPVIESLNSRSQPHARLLKENLVPMPYTDSPLPKNSKGTVLRNRAERIYERYILAAYKTGGKKYISCPDENLTQIVHDFVESTLARGSHLDDETDLFSLGIDSVGSILIHRRLQSLLPPTLLLPPDVVEMNPTVKQLAEHVAALRHGAPSKSTGDTIESEMWRLIERYGTFKRAATAGNLRNSNSRSDGRGEVVVLTGATGTLGTYVLHQLLERPSIVKVYCLVRTTNDSKSYERVETALERKCLHSSNIQSKLRVVSVVLSEPDLGLSQEMYDSIAAEATTFIHLAWSVNFRMRLSSFVMDNIAGLRHLLDLAIASTQTLCPKFLYCSSIASVANYSGRTIPEEIINDPTTSSSLGYSQSKWVAEQICYRAGRETSLKGRIAVLRVGQLCGDSTHGIWSNRESWPLMLGSLKLTGALPDLGEQVLDWLPVDIAAQATTQCIDAIEKQKATGRPSPSESALVFHIVNDQYGATWKELITWMRRKSSVQVLPPMEWVKKLEIASGRRPDYAGTRLLDHWRSTLKPINGKESFTQVDTYKTKETLEAIRNIKAIDEKYFTKVWIWIRDNI